MHPIPLLEQLVLILLSSLLVVSLFHRLKLPTILGFLLTGMMLGPNGLAFITEAHNIELVAEIGVILLLFTIGLEFSVKELLKMRKIVFGGGLLQLLLTTFVVGVALKWWGMSLSVAVFLGLLVTLSSTAMVMKLLGDRGEWGSAHGRMCLGILLFQDLAIVILVLLVPMLAGQVSGFAAIAWGVGKAILLLGGILFIALQVVPRLLEKVVGTRSRELFSLTTVLVIFGTAWLTGYAGLSLAIGAFVSGIVVSESTYSHQMLSEILPLRDIFNGVFFVSVGMLADVSLLLEFPIMLPLALCGIILVKSAVGWSVASLLGGDIRGSLRVGLAIAQVGEFAFVLAQQGKALRLLSDEHHALFILASVLSMLLTPVLLTLADFLVDRLPEKGVLEQTDLEDLGLSDVKDHAVIVGYGINGRNVALGLRKLGVPYLVIELNGATVKEQQSAGEYIIYGDASKGPILEHAHLSSARVLVVTVAEAANARQIVAVARQMAPGLTIIVRTRFLAEVETLLELGAHIVLPEEYETSLHLMGLVMEEYGATSQQIWRKKEGLRRASYKLFRGAGAEDSPDEPQLFDLLGTQELADVTLKRTMVAAHQSIAQTRLRSATGAMIIGVVRGEELFTYPSGDHVLYPDDRLILSGLPEQLKAAVAHLQIHRTDRPAERPQEAQEGEGAGHEAQDTEGTAKAADEPGEQGAE